MSDNIKEKIKMVEKLNDKEIEKYLFDKYKYYVKKYIDKENICIGNNAYIWRMINEYQEILNECFHYDFPYHNDHYQVIKNNKTVYEYNL